MKRVAAQKPRKRQRGAFGQAVPGDGLPSVDRAGGLEPASGREPWRDRPLVEIEDRESGALQNLTGSGAERVPFRGLIDSHRSALKRKRLPRKISRSRRYGRLPGGAAGASGRFR